MTPRVADTNWTKELLNKTLKKAKEDEYFGTGGGSGRAITAINEDPIGTIISFFGITAPKDYLACDGKVYDIAEYRELADHFKKEFGAYNFFGGNGTTTFAVPDLRGEFLRGTGTNSHADCGNGSSVGRHQDGSVHNYTAGASATTIQYRTDSASWAPPKNMDATAKVNGTLYFRTISGTAGTSTTDSLYGFTSRPTNTSVLYCIKAKSPARLHKYSTDEQVVGTWINGKPIYERTWEFKSPTTSNNTTYEFGDIKIDEIISYSGKIYNTQGVCLKDGTNATTTESFYLWIRRNNHASLPNTAVVKIGSSSNWFNQKLYITIQYTKTTD